MSSTSAIGDPCVSCGHYPCRCFGPSIMAPAQTPHRCPVCDGCGTVPPDFYSRMGQSISVAREACRSCINGVIWR